MGTYIKNKILKYLGLGSLLNILSKHNQRIEEIEKLVQIGVDVHVKSDSWAVFCIQGKQNYVRFVNLPLKELRELQMLIRRYEQQYGSVTVDKPLFM